MWNPAILIFFVAAQAVIDLAVPLLFKLIGRKLGTLNNQTEKQCEMCKGANQHS